MSITERVKAAIRKNRAWTKEQVMAYLECSERGIGNLIYEELLTPIPGTDDRFDPEQVRECKQELQQRHEALLEIYRINDELDLGDESYG